MNNHNAMYRIFGVFFIWLNLLFAVYPAIRDEGFLQTSIEFKNNRESNTANISENISLFNRFKIGADNSIGVLEFKTDYTPQTTQLNINKAFIFIKGDSYVMEIGKDRIINGVGFAWNPADILNPQKSPFYQDSEKRKTDEGLLLSSLSLLGSNEGYSYEISTCIIPTTSLSKTKYSSAFKCLLGSQEFFIIGGFQQNEDTLWGGYFRSSVPHIDNVTFYSELQTVNFNKNWKYLIGLQIEPTIDFLQGIPLIQMEYFYHPSGFDSVQDYLSTPNSTTPVVGELLKNYVYLRFGYRYLSYQFFIGAMKNMDSDNSGIISLEQSINLSDETILKIGGFLTFGDKNKEFTTFIPSKYETYAFISIYFDTN